VPGVWLWDPNSLWAQRRLSDCGMNTAVCNTRFYIKQHRQYTYNVTLWRFRVTIIVVETKQCVLSIVELQATVNVWKYCCTQVRLWRIYVCGINKTSSGLHAKCPMFLFDFKQIWSLSMGLHESPRYQIHGNPSSGSRIGTCGKTDMTKLIVSFRDYANTSENYTSC
jgi:hypothetical protein